MLEYSGTLIRSDWYPYVKEKLEYRHKENAVCGWRQTSGWCFNKLGNISDCQQITRSQGEGKEQVSPSRHSEETNFVDTFLLDFWPLDLWDSSSLLFKPPVCSTWLQQSKQANPGANKRSVEKITRNTKNN